MKEKKIPTIFYVVSLEFGTSGCDDICFSAKEVKNSLAKFIKANKKGTIVIKQYRIDNKHIIEESTKNEFIRAYFDGFLTHRDISHIKEMNIKIEEYE